MTSPASEMASPLHHSAYYSTPASLSIPAYVLSGKKSEDSVRAYYPSHHHVNSPEARDARDTKLILADSATTLIVADDRLTSFRDLKSDSVAPLKGRRVISTADPLCVIPYMPELDASKNRTITLRSARGGQVFGTSLDFSKRGQLEVHLRPKGLAPSSDANGCEASAVAGALTSSQFDFDRTVNDVRLRKMMEQLTHWRILQKADAEERNYKSPSTIIKVYPSAVTESGKGSADVVQRLRELEKEIWEMTQEEAARIPLTKAAAEELSI